jgi:hypothetical protein
MSVNSAARRVMLAGQGALLLVAAACAQLPRTSAVAIPPIPANEGRIWFYRAYEPYAGKGLPAVAANGVTMGSVELGGAFYRDVPPGHYHVTVETVGVDVNQTADFDLPAGGEAYVKIVSNPEWVSYGSRTQIDRPTFYAWLIPNEVAQSDVSQLAFYGGG